MPALVLTCRDDPALRAAHLSVDGMSAQGPNLSHWPGNRTPRALKADLSTGICLRFARAEEDDRARWLEGATQVLNTHYDTDGFLSLLAVLRPEVALGREEVCLAAAATGDYGTFVTRRAFAIDRIVLALGTRAGQPLHGALDGLSPAQRDHVRYAWLLDNARAVLETPERFAPLYQRELDAMLQALAAAQAGGLARALFHREGLSVLRSDGDVPRMVLNTFSVLHRVLHVRPAPKGRMLYRLHERTESWFEMVTIRPPERVDLRPLAARLQELEGRAAGEVCWNADPADDPIPEVYFGVPVAQEYGEVSRVLAPSSLPPDVVVGAVRSFFAAATTAATA